MRSPGRVSDPVAAAWLADLITRSPYLGLSAGDPYAVIDPLTVELTGNGYGRVPVSWSISGRLLRNSVVLAWVGISAGTSVTHITGWTTAFNGALSFAVPYGPVLYSVSGGLTLPINSLFVGLDA